MVLFVAGALLSLPCFLFALLAWTLGSPLWLPALLIGCFDRSIFEEELRDEHVRQLLRLSLRLCPAAAGMAGLAFALSVY